MNGQIVWVRVIFLAWVMEPVGGHKGPPQGFQEVALG